MICLLAVGVTRSCKSCSFSRIPAGVSFGVGRSGTPTRRPEYLFVDLSLSSYERESAALLGRVRECPARV